MERQREELWNGGKYPASREGGLAASEFANDASTSSRSTTPPPEGPSSRPHDKRLDQARERAVEFARDYRDFIAIAGGIVIGVVAAQLLLRSDRREMDPELRDVETRVRWEHD